MIHGWNWSFNQLKPGQNSQLSGSGEYPLTNEVGNEKKENDSQCNKEDSSTFPSATVV